MKPKRITKQPTFNIKAFETDKAYSSITQPYAKLTEELLDAETYQVILDFSMTTAFKTFAKSKLYRQFMRDYEKFCIEYKKKLIIKHLNNYLQAKQMLGKKIKKPRRKWKCNI